MHVCKTSRSFLIIYKKLIENIKLKEILFIKYRNMSHIKRGTNIHNLQTIVV